MQKAFTEAGGFFTGVFALGDPRSKKLLKRHENIFQRF
jgi:hypothetical protein